MYRITVKSGIAKGSSWVVGQEGISIGRDGVCDVMLRDPLVSRHHCRLVARGENLAVEDLGSSNATLINGMAARQGMARPGDEIAIGRTVFVVGMDESSPLDRTGPPFTESTLSLADHDSVYLSERALSEAKTGQSFSVADMVSLFQGVRRFSTAATTGDLLERLRDVLVERLHPHAYWFMLTGQTSGLLDTRLAGGVGVDSNKTPPDTILQQAIRERRGFLIPTRILSDGKPLVLTMAVAPLAVGDQCQGVVAALSRSPRSGYDEADLQFLVALAISAAPYFLSLAHQQELEHENARLRASGGEDPTLVGDSEPMIRLVEMMRRVADSDQSVLITGETGSGKDVVANLLHAWSPRAAGPFVPINCAAIPRELFESEVFGHEKGAFTGANAQKAGLLEQSAGGTLFLDEVGDLSLEHQARILRAIETKRFRRVGGSGEVGADFRILAATNRNPDQQLRDGTLREDLYHRLHGIFLCVPPLRKRQEDVPALARHFLERACAREGLRPPRTLTPQAEDMLSNHRWPGNVRELRACVEAALLFARGSEITAADLTSVLRDSTQTAPLPTLAEAEAKLIRQALDRCSGNVVEAAKLLGVGKDRVYRRLAQYRGSNQT